MDSKDINSQKEKLQRRIKYDADIWDNKKDYENALEDLLEDSENIGLSILYPFEDFSEKQFPKKYYNWQIRCCIELYNLADKQGITNYSENSLSWSKLTDGLSNDLMNKFPYSELLNKHNGVKQYEVNLYLTDGNDTDYPIYGTKQAGKDDIGFTLSSVKDQETTNKAKATEQ